jgi:hypothetical protein
MWAVGGCFEQDKEMASNPPVIDLFTLFLARLPTIQNHLASSEKRDLPGSP